MLSDILKSKELSVYKVAKESNISYSTLNDIVIEKTDIKKTSADVLYRLAKYLDMSMEALFTINDDKSENIYIHNHGRNIIVETSSARHQYLGPKNLVSFCQINKVEGHVIYVECAFKDDENGFLKEEDFIDLQDILDVDRYILNYNYNVKIGYAKKLTKLDLIEESMMVSDNMAVLWCFRAGVSEPLVEVRNLARSEMMAIISLNNFEIVETNMTSRMQKRAIEAVIRNRELIEMESVGEHNYA